ncbi:MAG: hypothetical protein AW10_04087 [Candidatus Accumulibacter appositus]|uniref:Uncharacterized protein n=1 Tax=Candidatus Accumulibacter appositus TaxID=1454003 RepID=A0A011QE54_9PROT|nr:MAG: hypothetical protein AW10_04087 [Candidatus Accumulibacter appositus]
MSPEAMWRNRYHEAGEQYLFGTEPLLGTPGKTAAGGTKGAVARRWRRQELGVDRRAGSRGHPSRSKAADRRRERLTSAPLQRFSRRQRFRQRRTAAAGGRRGLGRRRGGGRDDDTRKEIRPELADRWREWTTRHLLRGTRFRKGSRFHTPSYMTGSNLTSVRNRRAGTSARDKEERDEHPLSAARAVRRTRKHRGVDSARWARTRRNAPLPWRSPARHAHGGSAGGVGRPHEHLRRG